MHKKHHHRGWGGPLERHPRRHALCVHTAWPALDLVLLNHDCLRRQHGSSDGAAVHEPVPRHPAGAKKMCVHV